MASTSLQSPVTPDILQSGDQSLGYNLFPQAQQQIATPDVQAANARLTAATQGRFSYQDPNQSEQDRSLLDNYNRTSTQNNFSNVPLQSQAGSAALLASQVSRAQQVTGGSSVNPLSFVTNNPQVYANNQLSNLANRSGGFQGPDAPLPSGTTAQPATPQSLLNNPQFSAILQKDPQQAQSLFRAYTGQDLGQAMQQVHALAQKQNDDATSTTVDAIKGNNLTFVNGSPVLREKNPLGTGYDYKDVFNSDPSKQLSPATALQFLNPTALRAAGVAVTPDKNYMYRVLTYMNQGADKDQAAAMAKQDAMNGGQAATAQSLQQQPATIQPQRQQPSIQQMMNPEQQVQQDQANFGAASNALDEKINYGSGIAVNTLSGMGQTIQNIGTNFNNNLSRAGNVVNRLLGSNQPLDNQTAMEPSTASLIQVANQPSAIMNRRMAGGYGGPRIVFGK